MILDPNHPYGNIHGKLSCTPAEALAQFNFIMDPLASGIILRQYRYIEGGRKKTGTFISNYFPPSNPQTPAQQTHRAKMAAAVADWKTLRSSQRAQWNALAQKKQKKYMGYHLHNSMFIKGTI